MMTIVIVLKQDNTVIYLEDKLINPKRYFLIQAFEKIPKATDGSIAFILGADTAGDDTIFPLEKGYDLIAVETWRVGYELIIPNRKNYKNKIYITNMKGCDLSKLPQLDLIMASFEFPFYTRQHFREIWINLKEKIKPGGYFVGNFFGINCTIFKGKDKDQMSFYTKEEVFSLFKEFKIINFSEVQEISKKQDGLDHFYEIFAKKKRS
jgi:hypothetical protein